MFLISKGREFQTFGAEKENDRSPHDCLRVLGVTNLRVSDMDLKVLSGVYTVRQLERYAGEVPQKKL